MGGRVAKEPYIMTSVKKKWAGPAVVLYSWENREGSYGMRSEVGRFEAEADNGQRFTIIEYQDEVDVGPVDDPPATDPESIELFTADGERVMFKYEGTYEIVSSGLLVRRIP